MNIFFFDSIFIFTLIPYPCCGIYVGFKSNASHANTQKVGKWRITQHHFNGSCQKGKTETKGSICPYSIVAKKEGNNQKVTPESWRHVGKEQCGILRRDQLQSAKKV